jgi:hypothetical protein
MNSHVDLKRFFRGALLLALALLMIVRFIWGIRPGSMPVDDFVEYWSAGKLFLSGQNPYSPQLLLECERSAGYRGDGPLLMLNPPWSLPLMIPFALMNYSLSRAVWMVFNIILVIVLCDLCWSYYGGQRQQRWIAWILGLTFLPSVFVLAIGQIGPLMLAGLTAFLCFLSRGKRECAGAALILVAIKPHLLFLFWIVLLLWILKQRDLSILVGAATTCFLMSVAVTASHSNIWSEYASLFLHQPPQELWITTTFGALLRQILGYERQWLQFLPALIGVVWLIPYWHLHRENWNWKCHLPTVLFMSLGTTPYAWVFDQVLLLPAVVQVGASASASIRISKGLLLAYSVASVLLLVTVIQRFGPLSYLWTIPTWYALYRFHRREL